MITWRLSRAHENITTISQALLSESETLGKIPSFRFDLVDVTREFLEANFSASAGVFNAACACLVRFVLHLSFGFCYRFSLHCVTPFCVYPPVSLSLSLSLSLSRSFFLSRGVCVCMCVCVCVCVCVCIHIVVGGVSAIEYR